MVVPRGLLNLSYICIVTYVVSYSYRVTDKKWPYLVVLKHVILHNFYKSIVLGNYVVVGVNNIDKRNNVVEEIIIMINITMSSSVVIIMHGKGDFLTNSFLNNNNNKSIGTRWQYPSAQQSMNFLFLLRYLLRSFIR